MGSADGESRQEPRVSRQVIGIASALAVAVACAFFGACGADSMQGATNGGGDPDHGDGSTDFCATPNEGCPCTTAGEVADCGKVTSVFGQYVTCSEGTRTCNGTTWGECVGEYVTQKAIPSAQFAALGTPTSCSDDPCSPYCNVQQDTPGGFDAGPGFSNGDGGLTLGEPTGGFACTSLTLTASKSTLDVTDITPLTASGNPIALTAKLLPAGCASEPFATTWTIDRSDRALITGDKSNNGSLSLAVPIIGTINVTAYAAGLVSAPLPITVTVHATETTSVSPNTTANATQIGKFTGAGTTASTIQWLYPYDNTYYPLSLLAPVMQYKFATSAVPVTSSPKNAVKFSLRYPPTATEAAATFNYSIIVDEPTPDPQVTIPQDAWDAFAQSIKGQDGALVIQRWTGGGSGKLENESKRTIRIVNAQLKGTVYYTSYNSAIGGSSTDRRGAVLAIKPDANVPTVAVPAFTTGVCTTCHTVNAQGTRLIAAGGAPGGTLYNKDNSALFDLQTGTRPVFYGVATATKNAFSWGAPYPDGSFYMTSACDNYQGARNRSQLLRTNTGIFEMVALSPISMSTWTTQNATSPAFSPDGRFLAWTVGSTSYNATTCKVLAGKQLKVVSFDCQAPSGSVTCGTNTSLWKVSNERNLTGTADTVGHSAFLPDSSGVVYQKVIQEPTRHPVETLGNSIYLSPLTSNNGARGEIWLSNVPASGSGTPVRLNWLNGYNASGTSYLPTTARDITPTLTSYHNPGDSIGWLWENNSPGCRSVSCGWFCTTTVCDVASGNSPVYDYQLNYAPTVNPTSAGGFNWVIFQSRRMYGNIAAGNPWGQEGCGGSGCGAFGVSTAAPLIEPKKLWVSALDATWTAGGDPSHPAFYLPGQELTAGNSRAYWVDTPCSVVGASCDSNYDCCDATGASPTAQCQIDTPLTSPPTKHCQAKAACTPVGQGCDTTSDCCTGLVCPSGGGTCLATGGGEYTKQTFRREYVATCPPGSRATWRFFSWKTTIPAGTSIDFAIQTKAKSTDSYLPATPIAVGSSSTTATSWTHGAQTSDDVLKANGLSSMTYLLVSMTFNPTSTLAPTLNAWEQKYDCVPAE